MIAPAAYETREFYFEVQKRYGDKPSMADVIVFTCPFCGIRQRCSYGCCIISWQACAGADCVAEFNGIGVARRNSEYNDFQI